MSRLWNKQPFTPPHHINVVNIDLAGMWKDIASSHRVHGDGRKHLRVGVGRVEWLVILVTKDGRKTKTEEIYRGADVNAAVLAYNELG